MAKFHSFTEQLIRIIKRSKLSRYAIYKRTGIDQAVLSRFVSGKAGLSLVAINKLTELFRIELSSKEPE